MICVLGQVDIWLHVHERGMYKIREDCLNNWGSDHS